MYWERIDGWFNYHEIYDTMAHTYDNTIFVELGVWKGKSVSYLAEQVKKYNKNIKIYAIDLFAVVREQVTYAGEIAGTDFYEIFLNNIKPLKDYIIPIRMSSHDAHIHFEDNSIDFLYIDAEHTYDAVIKDLNLWYPKIKINGHIGGHDYYFEDAGVKKAVEKFFYNAKSHIQVINDSWLVKKVDEIKDQHNIQDIVENETQDQQNNEEVKDDYFTLI